MMTPIEHLARNIVGSCPLALPKKESVAQLYREQLVAATIYRIEHYLPILWRAHRRRGKEHSR